MGLDQPGESVRQESHNSPSLENGQQSGASNVGEDVWNEECIEKALETLKEMHIQVSTHFAATLCRGQSLIIYAA